MSAECNNPYSEKYTQPCDTTCTDCKKTGFKTEYPDTHLFSAIELRKLVKNSLAYRNQLSVEELILELERRRPDCKQCSWPTCDLCLNCFWEHFGGKDMFKQK